MMKKFCAEAALCAGAGQRLLASRRHSFGTVSTLAIMAGVSFSASQPALAQTAAPADQAPVIEEVVVTGSRIVRDGYEAPTPVSVLSAEQIQSSGVSQLSEFVNQLPSIAGSATPVQTSVSNGLQGIATINLRSLGSNRTLVLLDGQRSVPTAVTGEVDTSNFPGDLVSRVDVVTGGASSAYGSDAIAGVVNFVLDRTFTGLKGEIAGGVTTYGDGQNWKASITGGTGFGSDRGHFLFHAETDHAPGIPQCTRDWCSEGNKIMLNPTYTATNGQPNYLVVTHAGIDLGTPGGIINTGPLKGIYFGPGGVPAMFNYGALTRDPYTVGGDWKSTIQDTYLALGSTLTRHGLFARVSYDVTDDINVFAQASWASTWAFDYDSMQYGALAIQIKSDNPFIPASVLAQMNALKLTTITIGSFFQDLGAFATDNTRFANRYVVGGNGKFDALDTRWNWDAYVQVGVTRVSQSVYNNNVKTYTQNAIDAVRAPNGAIICRSTLTAPNNGCVPFNVMGIGVNSKAALNYITNGGNPPHRNERFVQHVGAVNFNGEPFENWAGPVSFAFGIENRWEAVHDAPTSILDQTAQWYNGNFLANIGEYSVTEGYVETVVPLAKNTVWAQSLDFNGAIRATSYSVAGYVTTWKAGITYAPIDDIRFRVTRSRDIRAPNLSELFAAGTSGPNNLTDRSNNNIVTASNVITSGNINLTPEVANELGLGVVLQPGFFPGFSASVDYYNIHMGNAISSVAGQSVIDLCYQGRTQFCSSITRALVNNQPYITVRVQPQNFVDVLARGIDFEASYAAPLSSMVDSWDGNLSVRVLATRFLRNYTNSGVPGLIPVETAGQNTGSGPPNWRYQGTIQYSNETITAQLVGRGVSGGKYANAWIECTSGCPTATTNNPTVNYNHVDGALYFDTTFTYKFSLGESSKEELSLSIRNIMNSDPVPVHQGPLSNSYKAYAANTQLYDILGRTFRLALRFKM